MKNQSKLEAGLVKMRQRIAELEELEKKHKKTEIELVAVNQQLDATNQQLRASENQLKAYNEQLKASEQELTRQKLAAEQAREFAESIINTVRQPLIVLNSELKVVAANPYFFNTFQVSEKNTIGKLLFDLGNSHWNIPALKDLLKKILPGKFIVEDFEVEHSFESIGHKNMLLNASEMQQNEGKERLILLSIEDVTIRKRNENELKRLNKELEQKAEELQQILYITTHDLRSPLVNIEGFSKEMKRSLAELEQILSRMDFPADAKEDFSRLMEEEIPEALHYITTSTAKMDNLLKGLLALSRLGRQKMMLKKLDMKKLVNQVLEDFRFEIGKTETDIELGDLPDCIGDKMLLTQVFSNLVGNSLKFLDPKKRGKIVITGKKIENGSRFTIQDNGIGIPSQFQGKVFELFEKLDGQKQGIGMGLNIVKQIVEKHRGTVELDSEAGKGTEFTIFIPD